MSLAALLTVVNAQARTLTVETGASAQAALDTAQDGDTVRLMPGVHRGNLVVRKRVVLTGPGATVDGGGSGSVVRVEAAFATVRELGLRNGGRDLGAPDACVYVAKTATGAVLDQLTIRCPGFGVWVHETRGAVVSNSRITGSLEGNRPERGNAIQLFDGSKLLVRGNKIFGGRDGIYLSATDDSTIEDNEVEQARYGVHYMYSHRNTVRRNRVFKGQAGFALMYSRNIVAEGNLADGNLEGGFFLRDVEDCTIKDNRSTHNGIGLFFYGSTTNHLEHNLFRDNEIGVKIWGGSIHNEVTGNAFIGNRDQVFYVSSEDLVFGEEYAGNFWGDYMGWDQNGDGFGDRPYRVDSFTTNLVHRFPSAVLLMRSPALELLSHLEQRLPLLRVPTVVDKRPLMRTDL
ncbi:MAG: nitrous oxide reductase family maturation protein NosD [Polyangiaceae bacterium]